MKMVKIDKKIGFFTVQRCMKRDYSTEISKHEISFFMLVRGLQLEEKREDPQRAVIKKRDRKGRERYGTFNRDSVRRAELRDGVYDPDIRRNTGKRVGRSYLDHHGGNRRTLYHICPELERRKSGKGSAFIGIRNRKRTGLL